MGSYSPSRSNIHDLTGSGGITYDTDTFHIDDDNDRVGIGDTAPGTQLQIKSTAPYVTLQNSTSENTDGGCESRILFEDHANTSLAQIQGSHAGTGDDTKGEMFFHTHNGSSLTYAMGISENQFLGLGTASPTNKLSVYTNHTSNPAALFWNDGNNANREGISIRCGTDSPSSAADCIYLKFADGNGTAAGGVQCGSTVANPEFFNGSDERIKTNIAPTQIGGLNIINDLELIQFNWNSDFCSKQTLNKVGFRAQNCEQVYPEMVSEHAHENFDFPVKNVAKGELIPVLVKAVQELSQNNQRLEARIAELENK